MNRLLFATCCVALNAFAQDAAPADPPSADTIKAVMEYMESGKARGPALTDVVPCLTIDTTKGSPTYYSCLSPATEPVKKGTTIQALLTWYIPKDGKYDDVRLQYFHEDELRQTIDVSLDGHGRRRYHRALNLSKVGRWTIKVLRNGKELGSASVDVIPG